MLSLRGSNVPNVLLHVRLPVSFITYVVFIESFWSKQRPSGTHVARCNYLSQQFAKMTSSPRNAPEVLATFVSVLGGPEIAPIDIEWAMDLSAGRGLIEWFADQVLLDDEILTRSPEDQIKCYQAALERIGLEDEEVQTCVVA